MSTEKTMPLMEHLQELRRRLMVILIVVLAGAIVCFFFAVDLLTLISRDITLIYIRPAEALLAHIRLAVTAGVVLSSPLIFYQVIAFLAPALTKRERRLLVLGAFGVTVLFALGVSFAWFMVFPYALDFFLSFSGEQLVPWFSVGEYVSFVTGFILAFGLVFQLPLIFFILGSLGLVNAPFLRRNRKYALVLVVILSALITPPDVISQVLMIVPLMLLFELGVILVALAGRRRRRRAAAIISADGE